MALNSSPHSPQIPSPRPPQPKPARPAAYDGGGSGVIDFISTLMRLLGLSLSLLQVGVKGLWGSSQEPTLRFSHRVASQREKSHRRDPLRADRHQTACLYVSLETLSELIQPLSLSLCPPPTPVEATLSTSLVGEQENTL